MNQRTLVDVPATPKLTERQAFALGVLQEAGVDGLTPDALGAEMHTALIRGLDLQASHAHRCAYCKSTGLELLRALRRKGVARLRRVDGRTFWQATNLEPGTAPGGVEGGSAHGDAQRAPGSFGEFPEGF